MTKLMIALIFTLFNAVLLVLINRILKGAIPKFNRFLDEQVPPSDYTRDYYLDRDYHPVEDRDYHPVENQQGSGVAMVGK